MAERSGPPSVAEPGDSSVSGGLAQLSGVLLGEQTQQAIVELVVSLATASVQGVDGASVSMLADDRGGLTTSGATSDTIRALDAIQYRAESGPCVEAIRGGEPVEARLTSALERWPEFSASALDQGMRRIFSTPLSVRDRVIGALNLYSNDDDAFEPDARRTATHFARQASIVMSNAATLIDAEAEREHLKQALATRDTIGQAKGILMVRQRIGPDEAFDVLRRASQRTNRKLRDIAQEIVDSVVGQPPPD